MRFEKSNIAADLGTGRFKASRYVKTMVNRLSELPIANGDYDRTIIGHETTYLIEAEFEAETEWEFFDDLLGRLSGESIDGAVIDGAVCGALVAVKLSLTRTLDSHIGRFAIVLKEL